MNFRRKVCHFVRVGAILHGKSRSAEREENWRGNRTQAASWLCSGADNGTVSYHKSNYVVVWEAHKNLSL